MAGVADGAAANDRVDSVAVVEGRTQAASAERGRRLRSARNRRRARRTRRCGPTARARRIPFRAVAVSSARFRWTPPAIASGDAPCAGFHPPGGPPPGKTIVRNRRSCSAPCNPNAIRDPVGDHCPADAGKRVMVDHRLVGSEPSGTRSRRSSRRDRPRPVLRVAFPACTNASSNSSQASSSASRCRGSIAAASRGDMLKKSASNSATSSGNRVTSRPSRIRRQNSRGYSPRRGTCMRAR